MRKKLLNNSMVKLLILFALAMFIGEGVAYIQPVNIELARPGQVLTINGHKITVVEKDITPVAENVFSKRGIYEHANNPKLQQLRKQGNLLTCWQVQRPQSI